VEDNEEFRPQPLDTNPKAVVSAAEREMGSPESEN